MIILVVAAIISYFVAKVDGEPVVDTIVIVLIVIINAILGFIQEFKAEKSLENLRNMLVPIAKVLRDGSVQEVPTADIVPGDILIIEE